MAIFIFRSELDAIQKLALVMTYRSDKVLLIMIIIYRLSTVLWSKFSLDIGFFKKSLPFSIDKRRQFQCSDEHTGQNCAEKWKEMLELLFEDEHTFPKIQNFFIGNMCNYLQVADEKLFHWNRPLKMLHILSQLDGTK